MSAAEIPVNADVLRDEIRNTYTGISTDATDAGFSRVDELPIDHE